MCGWSCDSDYRGLKKRIKAIELAERGENDQMAGSVSSDSEHGSLSSPSVASKWTHPIFHRENSDGGRAAHAHDKRRTQLTIAEAPDGELELEELRADGKDFVKVGTVLPCRHVCSIFIRNRRPLQHPTSCLLSSIQAS